MKTKELIKLANKGQDYEYLVDEIDEMRDKRQTLLVEDASSVARTSASMS